MKTNFTISHNLHNGWTNPKVATVHKMPPWQKAGSACPGALGGVERRSRVCSPRAASLRVSRARLAAVQGPVYLSPYFVRSLLFSCRKVILGGGGQEMPYGNRKPKWFMCWGMRGRGDGAAHPLFLKALYELIYCQRK